MADMAPAWVVPAMRAGYAARGLVYVIVGGIAVSSAFRGGQAEGAKGAIASMQGVLWGQLLLWAVALGLLAYAVWRGLSAWMDLELHGNDAKGMIARIGTAVSGVIHLGLAFYAARMALGGGGSGSSTESWTAKLMQMPAGRWLVVIVGLIVISAGIYYANKGLSERYKRNLRNTELTQKLEPACKFGLLAHGIAIGLIGGFFVYAGWTADPSEAGGLEQAFQTVRQAAFGRILLALMGLGFVGFAIYCWIEAAYRIVPARAGKDVVSLARAAKRKAEAHA